MNTYAHKPPQAIVLSCIDFRFHEKLKDELKKEKINSFDLLCLAGGAKNLASPKPTTKRRLAKAGGGSSQFKNIEKEIKFHQAELKKAENLIKKLFPDLRIKVVLLE